MRKILDSNYLQSPQLEAYLADSPANLVVVADYVWIEAYSGKTLKSIFPAMRILARYPSQVIHLIGTREAGALIESTSDPAARLIDEPGAREFREYCELLPRAERGDTHIRRQLLALGRDAAEQMERITADMRDFREMLKDFECLFSKSDVRALRTHGEFSDDFLPTLVKTAMTLTGSLCEIHPDVDRLPSFSALPDSFLFRMAVCASVLALLWVSVGGAQSVRAGKLRNDFVDSCLAAYATYFDGFLTDDQKAKRIYEIAGEVIRHVRENVELA